MHEGRKNYYQSTLPEVKYPKREASLKDNWRGKYRADKYAPGEFNEKIIEAPPEDEKNEIIFGAPPDDEEKEEEETPWNENALRAALERGMSLWRSHTGNITSFIR